MAARIARIIERVIEAINEDEVEITIRVVRSRFGLEEAGHISISPDFQNLTPVDGVSRSPAATLVHEILHYLYPTLGEADIVLLTSKVWSKLKDHQKLALYEYLFES